jgi:5-methylcytosine-specific restriction enzyme A
VPTRPPIHKPPSARVASADLARGNSAQRGYDRAWRKLRASKLAADPLCAWCYDRGVIKAAEMVDHIRPISTHPALRLVWSNLRSGCNECHDAHTRQQVSEGHVGMRARRRPRG